MRLPSTGKCGLFCGQRWEPIVFIMMGKALCSKFIAYFLITSRFEKGQHVTQHEQQVKKKCLVWLISQEKACVNLHSFWLEAIMWLGEQAGDWELTEVCIRNAIGRYASRLFSVFSELPLKVWTADCSAHWLDSKDLPLPDVILSLWPGEPVSMY